MSPAPAVLCLRQLARQPWAHYAACPAAHDLSRHVAESRAICPGCIRIAACSGGRRGFAKHAPPTKQRKPTTPNEASAKQHPPLLRLGSSTAAVGDTVVAQPSFRESRQPYPEPKGTEAPARVQVDDEDVPWSRPFGRAYRPADFTAGFVEKGSACENPPDPPANRVKAVHDGTSFRPFTPFTPDPLNEQGYERWADPEDPRKLPSEEWEKRQERSCQAVINFGPDGRPRNPVGRTGLRGRGTLGGWGPVFAADLIVTRWKPGVNGVLDVLTKPHATLPELRSLFGATLRGDEQLSKREIERLANILARTKAMRDEFRDNKLSDVSKSKWSLILRSYVDDPRNTDNSWMETSVYHLHLNDLNEDPDLKDSLLSALLSDAAPRMSKQSRSWMLEKDIADADALSWMSVDDNRLSDMFGNHSRMVLTVRAALMPDVKIIPLQNSRLIPLVSSSPEQDTLLEMLRAEKRLALLVSLATTDINAFHEA